MSTFQRRQTAIGVVILALLGLNGPAATHYVVPVNPAAAAPYTSWETAGTNISDVVNVAMTLAGTRVVWVTNGTYYPANQIVVTNALTLRSVNGRDVTILNGSAAGDSRCAVLTMPPSGVTAVFDGFTVTNYNSKDKSGTIYTDNQVSIINCLITGNRVTNAYGGGIYSVRSNSAYPKITNCIVRGNWAGLGGGGIRISRFTTVAGCLIENNTAEGNYGGGLTVNNAGYTANVISNCVIINNRCNSGTAGGISIFWGGLNLITDCVITGNVARSAAGLAVGGVDVVNTIIVGNSATSGHGGGVQGADINLRNCLIAGNSATTNGGGVYLTSGIGTMVNCTIAGNTAGTSGGGVYLAGLGYGTNSIIYHNTAGVDAPNFTNIAGNVGLDYSCVSPAVDGVGNITADPALVNVNAGDYRLRMNSPCIDAGAFQNWMTNATDLSANARILHGVVDMGAYEAVVTYGTTIFIR